MQRFGGTRIGKQKTISNYTVTLAAGQYQSTTDPDARLAKKATGKEAQLSYTGPVLMENRNGRIVTTRLTKATGTAECTAALEMAAEVSGERRVTLGGDKG